MNKPLATVSLYALAIMIFPGVAAAQVAAPASDPAPAATAVLGTVPEGDIVVTALKRSTLLEKTPIAINVISGDTLAREGITQIGGLGAKVPSVTLSESPGGLTGVSVRGVGTSASSQAFEQSVGLFLDGVYHPRARQYRDALFDVEQIEVIKGAQGVLFGKNTSVGAISVRTRDPHFALGGDLQGTYETRFDSYTLQGGIDIPVGPTAALRVAGLYEDEGGWVRNVTKGRDEPATKRLTGRITFKAEATPDFTVTIKAQLGRLRTRGDAFDYLIVTNPAALVAAGVLDGGGDPRRKYESSGSFGDSFDSQHGGDGSITLAYDAGGVIFTSLTGYSAYSYANGFDSDSSPNFLVYQRFDETFDQFTQEFRASTDGSGPVQVTAGLFYLDQNDRFVSTVSFNNFRNALTGTRVQRFVQEEQTYSAFGQTIWTIAGGLKATFGGRFSRDRKGGDYRKTIGPVGGVTPLSAAFPFYAPPGDIRQTLRDDSVDYAATLSYDLTDRAVAYASVGRGTKSGGFNNSALVGIQTPTPFAVAPEEATTYEVGVKGRFVDNRVYVSIAAWRTDIDAFQDAYYDSLRSAFIVRSLDAKTRGVEGEIRATATDWLTLFANASYLPTARLATGERMQRAPEFTSLLGGQIGVPIGNDLKLGLTGQWNHSTTSLNQAPSAPGQNDTGGFDLFDARLSLAIQPAKLELFVAGANLSDERYRAFSFAGTLGAGTVGTFNRPRTVTVGVRKTF